MVTQGDVAQIQFREGIIAPRDSMRFNIGLNTTSGCSAKFLANVSDGRASKNIRRATKKVCIVARALGRHQNL